MIVDAVVALIVMEVANMFPYRQCGGVAVLFSVVGIMLVGVL